METRYKWGYRSYKKMPLFIGQNGEKVYFVKFSNLGAETQNGQKPSLYTEWNEVHVFIETNTPKKLIRAACAEFRTETELRQYLADKLSRGYPS